MTTLVQKEGDHVEIQEDMITAKEHFEFLNELANIPIILGYKDDQMLISTKYKGIIQTHRITASNMLDFANCINTIANRILNMEKDDDQI